MERSRVRVKRMESGKIPSHSRQDQKKLLLSTMRSMPMLKLILILILILQACRQSEPLQELLRLKGLC